MNRRLFILIFALPHIFFSARIYRKLSEVCAQSSGYYPNYFIELPNRTEMNWDYRQAFEDGVTLGKGSFGHVKSVYYKSSVPEEPEKLIALKFMKPQDNSEFENFLVEVSALNAMARSNYVPRIYGCTYNKDNVARQNVGFFRYYFLGAQDDQEAQIYLAQELLSSTLSSTKFKAHVKLLTERSSLELWIQMFKGVRDLWEEGFVHNDIKPDNMMTNAAMNRIYLIDLGLASLVDERAICGGTPIYMSPAHFNCKTTVREKDDMYAIALSILTIEYDRGYDMFDKTMNGKSYPWDCFRNSAGDSCRNELFNYAVNILSSLGYGEYQRKSTMETINFTTLIANMIEYNTFSYSINQVITIIQRQISGFKAFENEQAKKGANQLAVQLMSKRKMKPDVFNQNLAYIQKVQQKEQQFIKLNQNIAINKQKIATLQKAGQKAQPVIGYQNNNFGNQQNYNLANDNDDKIREQIKADKKRAVDLFQEIANERMAEDISNKELLNFKNVLPPFKMQVQQVPVIIDRNADVDMMEIEDAPTKIVKTDDIEMEYVPPPKPRWEVIYEEIMKPYYEQYDVAKRAIEERGDPNIARDLAHIEDILAGYKKAYIQNAKQQAEKELKQKLLPDQPMSEPTELELRMGLLREMSLQSQNSLSSTSSNPSSGFKNLVQTPNTGFSVLANQMNQRVGPGKIVFKQFENKSASQIKI